MTVHQQNTNQNDGFVETFGMVDNTGSSSEIQMDSNESNHSTQQHHEDVDIEIQDQNEQNEEELKSHQD